MFRNLFFLVCFCVAAVPARAEWHTASSEHFVIYSEGPRNDVAAYARRLERIDAAMRALLGLRSSRPSPANRLTIFVVPDVSTVKKLHGGGSDIAGFYIGRATGSMVVTPRSAGGEAAFDWSADAVLFHEYTHHFLPENYPGTIFPAWFSEGFAEFCSSALVGDAAVRLGVVSPGRALLARRSSRLSLARLLTASLADLRPEEMEAHYSRAWLLTHFLLLEPSRRGQLAAYLGQVSNGRSSLEAAAAAFGDLRKLEADLAAYLRRPRLNYFNVPFANRPAPSVALRTAGPGEAALMRTRILLKRGVDTAEARALVAPARQIARNFPREAAALLILAEAEYLAGNFDDSERAVDRALAVDANAAEALVLKGRVKLAAAAASGSGDPESWEDARRWIAAANRLDRDDPEPMILYYGSFVDEGRQPPPMAAAGLVRALELAPHDGNLRMMVARLHLTRGDLEAARSVLAALALDPHSGGLGKAASVIMAALDRGGTRAALHEADELDRERAHR